MQHNYTFVEHKVVYNKDTLPTSTEAHHAIMKKDHTQGYIHKPFGTTEARNSESGYSEESKVMFALLPNT